MLTVKFSDGVIANVRSVEIRDTYEGVIECSCLSAGTRHYLADYEERRDLIEAGRLKGFYCFEPELIDEIRKEPVFKDGGSVKDIEWVTHYMGKCFKDNKLAVMVTFSETEGEYRITFEWYQTTRELSETPLAVLIQQMAGSVKYEDIKQYCKFFNWEELC